MSVCKKWLMYRQLPVLVFACVFFFGGFCRVAGASEETYVVFTEDLAPVHYRHDGRLVGIATEIVQAIFRQAGVRAVIRSYPWKRTYQYALHTKNGFIYTINRTAEREPLFQWIGPILEKRTYLYKLRSRKDIKVKRLADVRRYTTAVILGYALTALLEEQGFAPGRELLVTPNKTSQIKVFASGRADLITGNAYTLPWALARQGMQMSAVEPVLLVNASGYFLGANPAVNPEVITRLQRANDSIQRSGLVEQCIAKYQTPGKTPLP